MRDARIQHGGIDVNRDAQPIAEASLLDRQVRLQNFDLLLDAHFLRVRTEAHSQQVAQSIDHDVGGVDVASHQAGDRVQGVEQEMRLQLTLQRLQLRLGQPRLQPLGVERALLGLVPVRDGVAEPHEREVRRQHPVQLQEVLPLQVTRPAHGRQHASAERKQQRARHQHGRLVNQ